MADPLSAAKNRLARGEIDPDEFDKIDHRLAMPATSEKWFPSGLTVLLLVIVLLGGAVGVGVMFWGQIAAHMSALTVIVGIVAILVIIAIAAFAFMEGI